VLCAASRGGAQPVTVPVGPLGLGDGSVLFSTTDAAADRVDSLSWTGRSEAATVQIPQRPDRETAQDWAKK
jgi:hypothetical protein